MTTARKLSLRVAVAQRDGGRCVDCPTDAAPWPFGDWHADHIIPLSCGGADTLDNLATRCIPHHKAKTRVDGSRWARRRHHRTSRPSVAAGSADAMVPVVVRMDQHGPGGIDDIDALAVLDGVTRSEWVRRVLDAAMAGASA